MSILNVFDFSNVCTSVRVSSLAGNGNPGSSDGIGTLASFQDPVAIAISHSGAFALIGDRANHKIRRLNIATAQVTTLAGSGTAAFADNTGTLSSFNRPENIAFSLDDSYAMVADGLNNRIRRIDIATGVVTTLVGGNSAGAVDAVGTLAALSAPRGVALAPDGSFLLITDEQNFRVRRLDMATRAVTTLAGSSSGFADGIGTNARFGGVFSVVIDPTGAFALVSDFGNQRVRRLDVSSAQVSTLAGSTQSFADGIGTNAFFNGPHSMVIDPTGQFALISDFQNNRIRRIVLSSARVTTFSGTGSPSSTDGLGALALFNNPVALAVDSNWTFALVSDLGSHRIRLVALTSPCAAGFYCPSGSSSATQIACNASGFYCPAGSSSPTQAKCAVGYFCASGGSSAMPAACNVSGFHCPSGSSSPTQMPCAAGFACPAGSFNTRGAADQQGAVSLGA